MHWPKWAVADHNQDEDCWLVIRGIVYDMTHYDSHPGRREPFMKFAGLDATEAFEAMCHSWCEDGHDFGSEFIVRDLQLPREGNILRPSWILNQETVSPVAKWLGNLLLINVHSKLSYHDFWAP